MAHLIDSSVLITLERRNASFNELAQASPPGPARLAIITVSELLVGVHRADSIQRRSQRETYIEALLDVIPILSFDFLIAQMHARLTASLMVTGRPIGSHDLLIAATAVANGYELLTENVREFGRVPGLTIHQPSWS